MESQDGRRRTRQHFVRDANPDPFDPVVTDWSMPGMSGREVEQALKAIRADLPLMPARTTSPRNRAPKHLLLAYAS